MGGEGVLGEAEPTEADLVALAALILELRREGISDRAVLSAIEAIPRRLFLDRRHQPLAYRNAPLPIECGQTISQPSMVALMTAALDLSPTDRVLEVGTGSGYQAAVLSRLAAEVVTIERYHALAALARERLDAIGADNVTVLLGDGALGDRRRAPFDRILVTAAAPQVPPALLDQLVPGGVLVAPVGPPGRVQSLVRLVAGEDGLREERLAPVRFVALQEGPAEAL